VIITTINERPTAHVPRHRELLSTNFKRPGSPRSNDQRRRERHDSAALTLASVSVYDT
jgi:hypothetical protein